MPTLEEILKAKLGTDDADSVSAILEQAKKEADALIDKEVGGLKKKRDELLELNKSLKKNQIPDDFDMDEYSNLIKKKAEMEAAQKEAEEAKLIASENWTTLKDKLNLSHQEELNKVTSAKDKALNEIQNEFFTELKTNAALKELSKDKANATLLLPHVLPNISIVKNEDTNKFEPIVVDHKGNPRIDEKTGNQFTIRTLVDEMKANESYQDAFPNQNAGSGQGAHINKNFKGMPNPFKKGTDAYNLTAQAKLRREDPSLASAMQKAAGNT